jgi:hypothetical protein
MDEFKPRREQERELTQAEKRLTLALLQEKGRTFFIQEKQLTERLYAVKVVSHLNRLTDLATEKDAITKQLNELEGSTRQAQARLDRCDNIKEQIARCNQVAQSLAEVFHARRELNRTKEDLARLEHIEMVDLPAAQNHLEEITNITKAVLRVKQTRSQVQEEQASVREAQRLLDQLQQAEGDQHQKEEEVMRTQLRLNQRRQSADLEQQQVMHQLNDLETKKGCLEQALDLVKQWERACEHLETLRQEISETKAKQQEYIRLQDEQQQRENMVRERKEAADQAQQEQMRAADTVRFASAYEGLTAWIRLKGVEVALSSYATRQNEFLAHRQAAEGTLMTEQNKSRMPLLTSIVLSILAVLFLVAGFFWLPAFLLFVCFAGGAIASWIWFRRIKKNIQQHSNDLNHWTKELQQLDMERQAAIRAGGDPVALRYHEHQIQEASLDVPSSLDAGQKILEDLKRKPDITDTYHAREAAQVTRDNYVRLSE